MTGILQKRHGTRLEAATSEDSEKGDANELLHAFDGERSTVGVAEAGVDMKDIGGLVGDPVVDVIDDALAWAAVFGGDQTWAMGRSSWVTKGW